MTGIQIYAAVTQVINAIVSFSLGTYVLFKNPRPITNRLFAAFAYFAGLWGATYAMWVISKDMERALFWNRALMVGCVPIPSVFLHFVISFLGQNSKKRGIVFSSYIVSGLILIAVPTPFLVASVSPKAGFPYWANPGPLFSLYFVHFTLCLFYSQYLMYQQFRNSTGNRRNQIKYVLLGTFPAFVGGATNFPLWYNIPIPPIGNILVAAYVGMFAYAILQHHLMDIDIVLRKSLIYSLLITFLTAGYFGLIYLVERLFQSAFGYRSLWLSLVAFALMALAFQPTKGLIQRFVDRLVFHASQEQIARRMERLEEESRHTEKFRAVATMAAGMAHEIKNPLTAIHTFAEFVPEKHADPEFARKLHEVLTVETKRIQRIVQEVLDFAKPKTPRIQSLDLKSLLESTLDLLSGDLLRKKIHCQIDYQHNGAHIRADSDQLRQVLINLIQNATDAMPNGGKLTIATQAVNSHLELTVSDTGHGIPAKLLSQIFDPFVTTKSDGNGLGLAMVHSIIRAHGGTIQATSQPSHGTTFTVNLPL